MLLGALSSAYRRDAGRLNRFGSEDWRWLRSRERRKGGFDVGKFNAGQKLNAALTAGAVLVLLGTGVVLFAPDLFRLSWRTGATFVHDWTALALGLLVLGHLRHALADPDAREGMRTGRVTRSWARREHPAWVRELEEDLVEDPLEQHVIAPRPVEVEEVAHQTEPLEAAPLQDRLRGHVLDHRRGLQPVQAQGQRLLGQEPDRGRGQPAPHVPDVDPVAEGAALHGAAHDVLDPDAARDLAVVGRPRPRSRRARAPPGRAGPRSPRSGRGSVKNSSLRAGSHGARCSRLREYAAARAVAWSRPSRSKA